MSSVKPKKNIVLIGAGIMSTSLATFLKELDPTISVTILEMLDDCGQESSNAWNNAGTGHAANCELNYTPMRDDGSIDITKALEVNVEFDVSREFWSYLVEKGAIKDPGHFIHACPHLSFVWDDENCNFLEKRFEAMSKHHCYHGMEYSTTQSDISKWAPLTIEGRDSQQRVAATRIVSGADVDYGALTHLLASNLSNDAKSKVLYKHKVVGLKRDGGSGWIVSARSLNDGCDVDIPADFVFIGAGGNAVELLRMSEIPEGKGYAGFPVSGIWFRCDDETLAERHHAKVYGKAPHGSPPMSVPHLDLRVIDGKKSLLFGPYAGFSTKFLKQGSSLDLFKSVTLSNIVPLLSVARDDWQLSEYLISQVLQSSGHQFEMLRQFFPNAERTDWKEAVAGQRVQIIKPDPQKGGVLEFGTELVASDDSSLVALLGASPGASTAAFIAQSVLKKCFSENLTADGWLPKLKMILPSFGVDLSKDADACRESRIRTAKTLSLEFI
jgi:malate dehydrogenase (quinone)